MDPDDPSLTDDERHEAVMMHAEDLIDTLYRLRQKHPDAVIDDVPIDDMIAKLEEGLVSMQKADEEYNALRNRVIEMRAQMIYSAETIVQHLSFSFAVWVGHWRPRSPFIHEYYDATDARTLLSRNRWRPYHHHN